MLENEFDREKHLYQSDDFEELIKGAIRFFNGTPVHRLPPPKLFTGTGVYALYYIGKSKLYNSLYIRNRLEFVHPIYVGKAVPRGWRQARMGSEDGNELYFRLGDHAKSIGQARNLDVGDFRCRFMILENAARDLIGTVEAALIRHYKPVWNCAIDGFGNHDPGKGRYNQARSDWDVLHPGRPWADKCTGEAHQLKDIKRNLQEHFDNNGQ